MAIFRLIERTQCIRLVTDNFVLKVIAQFTYKVKHFRVIFELKSLKEKIIMASLDRIYFIVNLIIFLLHFFVCL